MMHLLDQDWTEDHGILLSELLEVNQLASLSEPLPTKVFMVNL